MGPLNQITNTLQQNVMPVFSDGQKLCKLRNLILEGILADLRTELLGICLIGLDFLTSVAQIRGIPVPLPIAAPKHLSAGKRPEFRYDDPPPEPEHGQTFPVTAGNDALRIIRKVLVHKNHIYTF